MGLFSGGTEIINDGALLEGGIPTATIVPWTNSSAPTGFLECNGSAVSRTTYSALFAIIGTTYGAGDGSTTFNVPDLQDNVPVGKSNNKALASTGGANTVAASGNIAGSTANATLSESQLASHDHNLTAGNVSFKSGGNNPFWGPQVPSPNSGGPGNKTKALSGNSGNAGSGNGHSHNMSANFSGSATSVVQPYLALIYIIKT
jgi:microcystin-dependent protein